MAQQTAVQMLLEYINKHGFDMEYEIEASFLEHEKEQIIRAWDAGYGSNDIDEEYEINESLFNADDYYNETYGE